MKIVSFKRKEALGSKPAEFKTHIQFLGSFPLNGQNFFEVLHLPQINSGLRHARIGKITLKPGAYYVVHDDCGNFF